MGVSAIPDSAVNQYDATQLSLSDGDSVSTWADAIGNADATAGTAPTYRPTEINGNPAVEYTGSEWLDTGLSLDTDQNQAVLAVIRYPSEGLRTYFGALDSESSRAHWQHNESPDRVSAGYGDSEVGGIEINGVGNNIIIGGWGDSGTFRHRFNGSEIGTFSYVSGGTVSASAYLGARNFDGSASREYVGVIGEVVRYQDPTLSDLQNEEQRLSVKWDITI